MAGKHWIACGAVLAALGVAAGAMGAHLLKNKLSSEQLLSYETAVRYQLFHALALVVIGLAIDRFAQSLLPIAAWGFLLGIVLFCGGIYGWLLTGSKPLVQIVPIGGLIWIVAWLGLAVGSWLATVRGQSVP